MINFDSIEWIECNLPWYAERNFNYMRFAYDSLYQRAEQELGFNFEQVWEEKSVAAYEATDEMVAASARQIRMISDAVIDSDPDSFPATIKYRQLRSRVDSFYAWAQEQPEYLSYVKDKMLAKENFVPPESFVSSGLNKPGTVVQLENGDYHIIGTIDQTGLDCSGYSRPETALVVKRYCHLVRLPL